MIPVVRVLKSLGGMIGDRLVCSSFTVHIPRRTTPMTKRAIVCGDDQLVSLKLKPNNRQITPAMTRKRPKKSNSRMCCSNVRPWCGLRFKKKNSTTPATPPVGLLNGTVRRERSERTMLQVQVYPEAPSPGYMISEHLSSTISLE